MLEEKIDALTASNAELVDVIKELIGKLETGEITAKPPAKTPAKKSAHKPAPEAEAKPEKDNVKQLKKAEPESKSGASLDDAREALMKVREKFDAKTMFAILDEVAGGAQNMSEVKEAHFPGIVEACEAKLVELAEAA